MLQVIKTKPDPGVRFKGRKQNERKTIKINRYIQHNNGSNGYGKSLQGGRAAGKAHPRAPDDHRRMRDVLGGAALRPGRFGGIGDGAAVASGRHLCYPALRRE